MACPTWQVEQPLLDDAGWGVGNHALIAFGPRIAIRRFPVARPTQETPGAVPGP